MSQLCQQLIEDDHGNLWISSFGEIQKYNGYDVTIFPTDQSKQCKAADNDLKIDLAGNIWVIQGTVSSKIYENHLKYIYDYQFSIIDPIEDKVIQFEKYIASDSFSERDIKFIRFVDRKIYLVTKSNKVYIYNEELEYCCDLKDSNSFLTISARGKFIHFENNALNHYNQQGNLTSSVDSQKVASHDVFVITKDDSLIFLKEASKQVKFNEYTNGIFTEIIELPTENFIYNNLISIRWTTIMMPITTT